MPGEGQIELQKLQEAGFTGKEIESWRGERVRTLGEAGFSGKEIGEYFGEKEPDLSALQTHLEANFKTGATPASTPVPAGTPAPQGTPQPSGTPAPGTSALESFNGQAPPAQVAPEASPFEQAKQVASEVMSTDFESVKDNTIKSLEAGYQMSSLGLFLRGKVPDQLMPEHAPTYMRIASQIGNLAGDVPAMAVGYVLGAETGAAVGGAAGSAIPVIGNVAGAASGAAIGGNAGAFALPTFLRETLMDSYQKGEFKSFGDFWERATPIFLKTMKSAAVGGATGAVKMGVGGLATAEGVALTQGLAPAAYKTAAVTSAELVTMVGVGKALEGEVPTAQDFIDGGLVIAALHGVGMGVQAAPKLTAKLQGIYRATGLKPADVIEHAKNEPTVLQDLISTDKKVPDAYTELADPKAAPKIATPEVPKELTVTPEELGSDVGGRAAQIQFELPKEAPKPVEPPAVERPAAVQTVLDRIGTQEKVSKGHTFDTVYTNVIDDLHPLKRFTEALANGEKLPTTKDPYQLARLIRGSAGKADQAINYGPFKYKSLEQTGTRGLKQILEPVEDLDGFRAYAAAKRAVELHGREIETGIDHAAATETVKWGGAKFEKTFRELNDYQNDMLSYLKDAGILSEQAHTSMKEANKDFVPFYRLMEEGTGKSTGKGMTVKNPVKGIDGSSRQIIDPIESIIKNTYSYIQLAERNRALTAMAELAETAGERGKEIMQRQPQKMAAIEVKDAEVAKFMKEHGIEGDPASFTIFRPDRTVLAKDEISLFRDGKREVYKVPEAVAGAVNALDRGSMNMLVKFLSYPASALRAGSVLSPDFMGRNFVRDQMTAFIANPGAYNPIHMMSGIGSLFKKDEHFQNWLKSGGANSAMVAIDRDYIQKNIFKLSKETGLRERVVNVVSTPVEMMRVLSELIENSTRLGEFKRQAGADASPESVMGAGLASREVTLDFSRMGASPTIRAMNSIAAFFNAHLQGVDKTARAIKDRPLETSLKIAGGITLPSVLLWMANKDDERYKELPRWQKDLFWVVMSKDHIYRIPKPEGFGLFGSVVERTLDAYYADNPNAFKDLAETTAGALIPGVAPTALTPVVEQWANKSYFRDSRLIPASLEKVAPEYQYTNYTSETAKGLGKVLSHTPFIGGSGLSSPIVLENYIRAWTGAVGGYALQLSDQGLSAAGLVGEKTPPQSEIEDWPFFKAFMIRNPITHGTGQSIQDFYDGLQESQRAIGTVHALAKQGQFDEMQSYMLKNQDKLVNLDGLADALATQSRLATNVYRNPEIPRDEKRQILDNLFTHMTETAKAGNMLLKTVKDSNRAQ